MTISVYEAAIVNLEDKISHIEKELKMSKEKLREARRHCEEWENTRIKWSLKCEVLDGKLDASLAALEALRKLK